MATEKKVKYLKLDRGRYYYQRRVPDQFQELLGISKRQMPRGNVNYVKAVQLVVNWAEEHAALLGTFDPQKPLWGAPFAVKDNIDIAGMPTTAACPAYAFVPNQDAFVVQKLRDAGAIVIGKTNLNQFATGLVEVRSPYGHPKTVCDPPPTTFARVLPSDAHLGLPDHPAASTKATPMHHQRASSKQSQLKYKRLMPLLEHHRLCKLSGLEAVAPQICHRPSNGGHGLLQSRPQKGPRSYFFSSHQSSDPIMSFDAAEAITSVPEVRWRRATLSPRLAI